MQEKNKGKENAKPGSAAEAPKKTTDTDHETVRQSPSQLVASNAAARKSSKSFVSASMSKEQNVTWKTLNGEKSERLTGVKFSISVGDAASESVHLYRLPARIVEYAPEYRDFDYILVVDDIPVLEPRTRRIVAVISA